MSRVPPFTLIKLARRKKIRPCVCKCEPVSVLKSVSTSHLQILEYVNGEASALPLYIMPPIFNS